MTIELLPLPYSNDDLEPTISKNTINYHYGKHHRAYVDNINRLIKNSPLENFTLNKIIKETVHDLNTQNIFNNAAQVFNHTFYWNCMVPGGGGLPPENLLSILNSSFSSYDNFVEKIIEAGMTQFGSGWVWLVQDNKGNLKIVKTSNADTPFADSLKPLLTIDVWEHAYYLDFQNRRKDYLQAFFEKLVNWSFVSTNLK